MAAFTPGPWTIDDRLTVYRGTTGPIVAEVWGADRDVAEAEANARLIVAAPELYAEVRRLAEAIGWPPEHPAVKLLARIDGDKDT